MSKIIFSLMAVLTFSQNTYSSQVFDQKSTAPSSTLSLEFVQKHAPNLLHESNAPQERDQKELLTQLTDCHYTTSGHLVAINNLLQPGVQLWFYTPLIAALKNSGLQTAEEIGDFSENLENLLGRFVHNILPAYRAWVIKHLLQSNYTKAPHLEALGKLLREDTKPEFIRIRIRDFAELGYTTDKQLDALSQLFTRGMTKDHRNALSQLLSKTNNNSTERLLEISANVEIVRNHYFTDGMSVLERIEVIRVFATASEKKTRQIIETTQRLPKDMSSPRRIAVFKHLTRYKYRTDKKIQSLVDRLTQKEKTFQRREENPLAPPKKRR